MSLHQTFLSDETLHQLELIDQRRHRFHCSQLEDETLMFTKEGHHLISLKPSTSNIMGVENTERIITIKDPGETRVESHRISTVRELADILNEEFGVSVLYRSKEV